MWLLYQVSVTVFIEVGNIPRLEDKRLEMTKKARLNNGEEMVKCHNCETFAEIRGKEEQVM